MWEMHDGWGWWMVAGWIWFLLFWGSLVALVMWVVNRGGGGERGEPLAIAKERLARGEIDEEEFQRIRRNVS
jgi:putative membrane protein